MRQIAITGLGKVGSLVGMLNGRAISWTTASSIAAMVELVWKGVLPIRGFAKLEDISLEEFSKTRRGSLYLHHQTEQSPTHEG